MYSPTKRARRRKIQQTRPHNNSSAARENPVFWMLIMHGGFFATCDSSGYCDWPQSNAEKRGAVKDKLFPAFISRHSLQCSTCYDKQYSLYFFSARRGAASGEAAP